MKKLLLYILLFVGCKGTPINYDKGNPVWASRANTDSISIVYKISHDTLFIHDTVYTTAKSSTDTAKLKLYWR